MKIPSEIYSHLGPVPVIPVENLAKNDEAHGKAKFLERIIQIEPKQTASAAWQTFFHEMTHYILWDSGLQNVLEDKQVEAVCDAVGTYLAASQEAGYLKVGVPRKV